MNLSIGNDRFENCIQIGLGVEDLIEKPVKGRRGPATVTASEAAYVTGG